MSRPLGARRGGGRTLFGGRGSVREPEVGDGEALFTDDELAWEDEPTATRQEAVQPLGWPVRQRRPVAPDGEATPYARRRLVAIGGLVALVVVAIVLGVTLTGGGSEAPEALPPATPQTPSATKPAAKTKTQPALRVTVTGGKPLKQGASGAQVKTLQRALGQLGFDVGKADGAFGSKTEAAVVAFQRRHGLTADGVVGAKTAAAINSALS